MLIATLPSADKREQIEHMYSCPEIIGARYNVGIRTSLTPYRALICVKHLAERYEKKLWIDLKGRQLRITQWADPTYGDIALSHEFEVEMPAKIFFRGNEWSNVVGVNGNRIVVDPDPTHALGAGQAVNIIGEGLRIRGDYLTDEDKAYIRAASKLGIHNYMLSFVEQRSDLEEVKKLDKYASLVLKIESQKGLDFVRNEYALSDGVIMAARDDLLINIGENKSRIIPALELIVQKDSCAIAASHIFNSIPEHGYVAMADISDLKMLKDMGYKNFMLSDTVSHRSFDAAVSAWKDFEAVYHR